MIRTLLPLALALSLAACATPGPEPAAWADADSDIRRAEEAGGDEFAPVEMRFARERLAEARAEDTGGQESWHLLEQAEINAELAVEKARTARVRNRVAEQREGNRELRLEFEEEYGGAFR